MVVGIISGAIISGFILWLVRYPLKPKIEKIFEFNQKHAVELLVYNCANEFFGLEMLLDKTSISSVRDLQLRIETNRRIAETLNITWRTRSDIYVKYTQSNEIFQIISIIGSIFRSFRNNHDFDFYNERLSPALFTLFTNYKQHMSSTIFSRIEDFIIFHKLELTKDEYDAICNNFN